MIKDINFKRIVACLLAAFFVLSAGSVTFAALSNERVNKDYRTMDILNSSGTRINKPISSFMAKRISNGEVMDVAYSYTGYDCSTDFPTLICYVGDTVSFEDLSYDEGGYSLKEWDWQYYGAMGDSNNIYTYDVVNNYSLDCTKPGETIFYLCVMNSAKVKTGCCDPWSENGNHQVVGRNRWFPNGAYWYFTAIRVIVKPIYDAGIQIRYWDALNGKVIDEEKVLAGRIEDDSDIKKSCIDIKDLEGYKYSGWKVRLEDDTVQYFGETRDVCLELSSYLPKKYLDIEYYPCVDTSVDIRYWDSAQNSIISSETVTGESVTGDKETTFYISLETPEGYKKNSWNVQLDNGTIQYMGTDEPVVVVLSGYINHKYLNVECSKITDTPKENDNTDKKRVEVTYIDEETGNTLDTETATVFPIELKKISGYIVSGWTLKKENNAVEAKGIDNPVPVEFEKGEKVKYLVVNCLKLNPESGGDDPHEPEITVKPSEECDGIIEWTETDYHEVANGYYSNGRRKYKKCYHTFTYRAVLDADAKITPDTFKSGYGFELGVNCKITKTLVSNTGDCRSWGSNRAAKSSVLNPTKATVYIPWNMTNSFGTQSTVIPMDIGGTLKFILPKSNISSIGARKIYTPPELPGTKEKPESHEFEIYINGGGVGRTEFCKKLNCKITINGDLYEDDFSGAD